MDAPDVLSDGWELLGPPAVTPSQGGLMRKYVLRRPKGIACSGKGLQHADFSDGDHPRAKSLDVQDTAGVAVTDHS